MNPAPGQRKCIKKLICLNNDLHSDLKLKENDTRRSNWVKLLVINIKEQCEDIQTHKERLQYEVTAH